MSTSRDPRFLHGADGEAKAPSVRKDHPAKEVMALRWEQRRAEAALRWAESGAERADASGVTQVASMQSRAGRRPADQSAPTEQRDASAGLVSEAIATSSSDQTPGVVVPNWLRNTPRALLGIALLSLSILVSLLYFGDFLR